MHAIKQINIMQKCIFAKQAMNDYKSLHTLNFFHYHDFNFFFHDDFVMIMFKVLSFQQNCDTCKQSKISQKKKN